MLREGFVSYVGPRCGIGSLHLGGRRLFEQVEPERLRLHQLAGLTNLVRHVLRRFAVAWGARGPRAAVGGDPLELLFMLEDAPAVTALRSSSEFPKSARGAASCRAATQDTFPKGYGFPRSAGRYEHGPGE